MSLAVHFDTSDSRGVARRVTRLPYLLCYTGFLAVVDFRRGFLFATYARSPYAAFHPAHLAAAVLGPVGMVLGYRGLVAFRPIHADMRAYTRLFTFVLLGLLVLDLFTYRVVPASRAVAAGKLGADWLGAFGVTGLLRPFALGVSYLLTVWHATLLGVLLGGLALVALPAYLKSFFGRHGFTGTVFGALYGLHQPFCSCCAAVMSPSYARRGASINFLLSFVVAAPMLNLLTIILAFNLLPLPFALLRVAGGLFAAVVLTWGAVRLVEREDNCAEEETSVAAGGWMARPAGRLILRYLRAFDVEPLAPTAPIEDPAVLIRAWVRGSARLAVVFVPTLLVWTVLTAGLLRVLPAAFGNNLPSVVLAALTGSLMMISTWTEIPVALQLIQAGAVAPAATLLIVLPAVSLPALILLAGALRQVRVVAGLALGVMLLGIAAGLLFLL